MNKPYQITQTQRQQVTYHPTLNSTCASKSATTGAVAALQPLTRERIRPSCLLCRTTLMNPGFRVLTSSTYSFSFSLSSSAEGIQRKWGTSVKLPSCYHLSQSTNNLLPRAKCRAFIKHKAKTKEVLKAVRLFLLLYNILVYLEGQNTRLRGRYVTSLWLIGIEKAARKVIALDWHWKVIARTGSE